MEVERSAIPTNDFLHKVRQLATDKGIILIFDECTSGFRETFGGLHKKYSIEPDMAMFGKAIKMVMPLQQLLVDEKLWR